MSMNQISNFVHVTPASYPALSLVAVAEGRCNVSQSTFMSKYLKVPNNTLKYLEIPQST